jgi:hypothetical protein
MLRTFLIVGPLALGLAACVGPADPRDRTDPDLGGEEDAAPSVPVTPRRDAGAGTVPGTSDAAVTPPPKLDAAPVVDPVTPPPKLDAAPPPPKLDAGPAPTYDAAVPPKLDAAPARPDAAPARPDAAPARPDAAPAKPDAAPAPASYLPLAIGATWTFKVTDGEDATVSMKKISVEALEDVGGPKAGTMAFRLRTDKGDDDKTVSWQQRVGDRVVRYRELSYKKASDVVKVDDSWTPPRMRVEERPDRLVKGATWTEMFQETKTKDGVTTTTPEVDQWVVDAVDEEVTVPAGTFKCLRLRKVAEPGKVDKIFWFARGVGKVKETGGQTEELASYSIPKAP